jgi:uncharacterized membrane protein
MSSWLIFALLVPVFSGLLNVIEKILRTNYIKDSLVLSMAWGLSVFLMLLATPFFDIKLLPFFSMLAALGAGVLYLLALIPFYYALSFEEVSRVAPLWQLSSVFVLFGAVLVLEENLRPVQYAAFIFIFLGGFLLSIKRTKRFFKITPAASFVILSGIFVAISHLLLKFGVQSNDAFSMTFWIFTGHLGASLLLFLNSSVRKKSTHPSDSSPLSVMQLFLSPC